MMRAEDRKTTSLDLKANRSAQKWSRKAQIGRVLWALAQPFWRLSPRPLWGWRRVMLRVFGAKVGRNVHIYPTAKITIPWNLTINDEAAVGDAAILYALGSITIGAQATVSQYAHICAGGHNYKNPDMTLTKPAIFIKKGAWVCTDAFVGGGVTLGEFSIAGARAVVTKDVAPNIIVGGNPAKKIGDRTFNASAQS